MNEELIDWIVEKVNSRVNVPLLNEQQEHELIELVVELIFLKLTGVFTKKAD